MSELQFRSRESFKIFPFFKRVSKPLDWGTCGSLFTRPVVLDERGDHAAEVVLPLRVAVSRYIVVHLQIIYGFNQNVG